MIPNLSHRWWYGDAREALATPESTAPNLRHRWWYGDSREAGATIESMFPNLRHRWGNGNVCKVFALSKGLTSYLCN